MFRIGDTAFSDKNAISKNSEEKTSYLPKAGSKIARWILREITLQTNFIIMSTVCGYEVENFGFNFYIVHTFTFPYVLLKSYLYFTYNKIIGRKDINN